MSIEQDIASEARRLGFAAVGFAALAPSESFPVFDEWLQSGRSAGMDYLKKHKSLRSDPREVAQGAKSAIVVAAGYPVSRTPGRGFSSYAASTDYHDVIRAKLKELAEFVRQKAAMSVARVCVDSAPVLEREWAVRAGIGWRGRQGQVVNPDCGCCMVLGELLVDIALIPSAPVPNQCGECRKCVDACPTGALCADGLIDARKCVSYLTIEHKGDFSPEESRAIGQSIFGCDICTAVCPWNARGDEFVMSDLAGAAMPGAEECVKMTEAEFTARFRNTSVSRTGHDRLKRNADAVIKNRADCI
jgi:epoxyqueuosine reductase